MPKQDFDEVWWLSGFMEHSVCVQCANFTTSIHSALVYKHRTVPAPCTILPPPLTLNLTPSGRRHCGSQSGKGEVQRKPHCAGNMACHAPKYKLTFFPFQCEICSKRFRYQSDLKNHFESHFRGGRRSGLHSNGDLTPRSRMVSRYLTRPCIYCGRTFTDHETLARHESAEAIEFEREANKFEGERRSRVTQSDLEDAPRENFHQVDIEST